MVDVDAVSRLHPGRELVADERQELRGTTHHRVGREDASEAGVVRGCEVAGANHDCLVDGAHAIADPDDEHGRELRRELHEANDVDRAREHPVRVTDVEHRRRGRVVRAAMSDEDLELVTDVLGPEVMHLGVGERRVIVRRHGSGAQATVSFSLISHRCAAAASSSAGAAGFTALPLTKY